uniref:MMS19 nucleotide excision repair protein n=1 Tax=Macrostomum lignano TaxID=282301 RepID=A0A1I8HRF3_9PLAT
MHRPNADIRAIVAIDDILLMGRHLLEAQQIVRHIAVGFQWRLPGQSHLRGAAKFDFEIVRRRRLRWHRVHVDDAALAAVGLLLLHHQLRHHEHGVSAGRLQQLRWRGLGARLSFTWSIGQCSMTLRDVTKPTNMSNVRLMQDAKSPLVLGDRSSAKLMKSVTLRNEHSPLPGRAAVFPVNDPQVGQKGQRSSYLEVGQIENHQSVAVVSGQAADHGELGKQLGQCGEVAQPVQHQEAGYFAQMRETHGPVHVYDAEHYIAVYGCAIKERLRFPYGRHCHADGVADCGWLSRLAKTVAAAATAPGIIGGAHPGSRRWCTLTSAAQSERLLLRQLIVRSGAAFDKIFGYASKQNVYVFAPNSAASASPTCRRGGSAVTKSRLQPHRSRPLIFGSTGDSSRLHLVRLLLPLCGWPRLKEHCLASRHGRVGFRRAPSPGTWLKFGSRELIRVNFPDHLVRITREFRLKSRNFPGSASPGTWLKFGSRELIRVNFPDYLVRIAREFRLKSRNFPGSASPGTWLKFGSRELIRVNFPDQLVRITREFRLKSRNFPGSASPGTWLKFGSRELIRVNFPDQLVRITGEFRLNSRNLTRNIFTRNTTEIRVYTQNSIVFRVKNSGKSDRNSFPFPENFPDHISGFFSGTRGCSGPKKLIRAFTRKSIKNRARITKFRKKFRCSCVNLSNAAAEAVFRSVTTELQVQTLNQMERMAVYQIFQLLLQNKLHFLKSINHDFVFGFVRTIDAEKDPRNLLIVFELFPLVVAEFDITRFSEDMFEVIACYFPVDFKPSASGSVTRDQLVELHSRCLSSTPIFGEFMVPLLLEKLASDLRSARLESFNLLRRAAPVYPAAVLLGYGQQLLAAFRRAMFRSAVSDEERRVALTAFAEVVARIARSDCDAGDDAESGREEFFRLLLKECRPNLRELDPNVMEATGRALESAVGVADATTRRQLVTGILPDILAGLADRKDSASKCGLLDILRRLLTASLSSYSPTSVSVELKAYLSGELESICAALYGLATAAAAESATPDSERLRLACLATMGRLCSEPGLASDEQRAGFAEHLLAELGGGRSGQQRQRLPGQPIRPIVRDYARRLAATNADEAASLINKGMLPLATEHSDFGVRADCLLLLGELCDLPESISEPLLGLLMRLCLEAGSTAEAAPTIKSRLDALCLATETSMASTNGRAREFVVGIWTSQFQQFLAAFRHYEAGGDLANAAFGCVQAFARALTAGDESTSVKSAVDWTAQQATEADFRRLHCALLFNLTPETARRHSVALLPSLASRYASDGSEFALQLYASLINKCLDYGRDPSMSPVEQIVLSDVNTLVANSNSERSAAFLAWCLKALLLSGSPLFVKLAGKTLDILRQSGEDQLAVQLAARLELLLKPCEIVLCTAAKATVGPLAGQKCLCLLLQPLLDDAKQKKACLLAAISLAQTAPPELIVDYIDSLIPALMLHLRPSNSANAGLRAPILRLLETLASRQDALNAMAPRCLGDLLPRLLACLDPGADLDSRRTSARLLRRLATGGLPAAELLPHKPDVVSRLGAALNDPKRLARSDAAQARNACWADRAGSGKPPSVRRLIRQSGSGSGSGAPAGEGRTSRRSPLCAKRRTNYLQPDVHESPISGQSMPQLDLQQLAYQINGCNNYDMHRRLTDASSAATATDSVAAASRRRAGRGRRDSRSRCCSGRGRCSLDAFLTATSPTTAASGHGEQGGPDRRLEVASLLARHLHQVRRYGRAAAAATAD